MNPYEIDRSLLEILKPHLHPKCTVLDAGCGDGEFAAMVAEQGAEVTGIDMIPTRIAKAKALNSMAKYYCRNIHNIDKKYDIVISHKVLSWRDSYEEMIGYLLRKVVGQHLFITSLFYDGEIDFYVKAKIMKLSRDVNYNIYSFPRFARFCNDYGAKLLEAKTFEIDIDLPRPRDPDMMGTYTVKTSEGKRLQISGALIMSWKIIHIAI